MSWRRGELWLDADLLWFREVAGAPAVADTTITARYRGEGDEQTTAASSPLSPTPSRAGDGACRGDELRVPTATLAPALLSAPISWGDVAYFERPAASRP